MSEHRIETVARDGLEFSVRDEGPIDGEPVVLLHGFPERATSWRYVTPLLHAEGYRTLAMDQRGYAPGARPRRRRDHRLPELVEDVVAVLDRLGDRAHVVGHDWGAVVAWALAAEHPDRVRTLTAVSVPHPQAFLRSWLTSRQGLKSWYMLAFQLPRLPEMLGSSGRMTTLLRQFGMTDEDVARFESEVLATGALRGGLMWYRGLPLTDVRRTAGTVTVPTTMVWSDRDGAIARAPVDRTAPYVAAPYELVVLEGVTHWIPTQAPRALADAILARAGAGPVVEPVETTRPSAGAEPVVEPVDTTRPSDGAGPVVEPVETTRPSAGAPPVVEPVETTRPSTGDADA